MNFELGKDYIISVSKEGIIPIEEFDKSRWYDKDHDDLDFLTDEEKIVVINQVLDKISTEIEKMTPTYHNTDWSITDLVSISKVLNVIDKYKAKSKSHNSEEQHMTDECTYSETGCGSCKRQLDCPIKVDKSKK